MTTGELIKDVRRRRGLSQRRLARRAGASQAWISNVERDEVSPSVTSVERLLLVMGEQIRLGSRPLIGNEEDSQWQEMHHARSMADRLERVFDAAGFARELRGLANPQR